jgi:hypothetical protein
MTVSGDIQPVPETSEPVDDPNQHDDQYQQGFQIFSNRTKVLAVGMVSPIS